MIDFKDVLRDIKEFKNVLEETITIFFEGKSEKPLKKKGTKPKFYNSFRDSNIDIERIKKSLFRKKQIILMGPPGTSKSYIAEKIGKEIAEKDDRFYKVQFHPDYSYEDFVEGLKAETNNGQLTFSPTKKIFRRICDKANKLGEGEKIVLMIDEINRGNVEKVFGELIWALENRNKKVKSLYFEDNDLMIPENLYIIATMNTVDLSIVNIDAALLRRFHIIDIMPDPRVLQNWLSEKFGNTYTEFQDQLLNLLEDLNSLISKDSLLGEYRVLGHAYFFVSPKNTFEETLDDFEMEWEFSIRPLLLNYLNFDQQKLQKYDELFEKFQNNLILQEKEE